MVTKNDKVIPEFILQARKEAFHRPLLNKYSIEYVSEQELWDVNWLEDFAVQPNEIYFEKDELSTAEQKEKLKKLEALTTGVFKLQDSLLIKEPDNGKIVGIFNGYKQNDDSYYMQLTAIHKNYRRLGLYSSLLDRIIKYTQVLGFNKITSCHSPINNAVLIAKLKKDFKILSMEIDAMLGINIWLCYFHNQEMQTAHELRCGHISFSEKLYASSKGTTELLFNCLKKSKDANAK